MSDQTETTAKRCPVCDAWSCSCAKSVADLVEQYIDRSPPSQRDIERTAELMKELGMPETTRSKVKSGWGWNGDMCAVWGVAIVLGETREDKERHARIIAAAVKETNNEH